MLTVAQVDDFLSRMGHQNPQPRHLKGLEFEGRYPKLNFGYRAGFRSITTIKLTPPLSPVLVHPPTLALPTAPPFYTHVRGPTFHRSLLRRRNGDSGKG